MALPRVILGCGSFGGAGSTRALWGSGADQAEAYRILDQAFELGITCLDTADAYGGGRSEEFIGGWLKTKSPADRARVLIATKVGQPVGPGPRDRGLSAAHIARQIDVSLSRLGVDAVAMYLIHHPDPDTPLAETIDALDQVVRAGKAGHLGICNVTTAQLRATVELARANGCAPVEWVQNPYNLLQREDEAHLLPYAVGTRLGYTAHSPLAGGWLTGKYQSTNSYPADSRMGQRPERYEYRLTKAGLDLYPVLVAMVQWGDEHLPLDGGPPMVTRHRGCEEEVSIVMRCAAGHEPSPREVAFRPGPSAEPRPVP